MRGSREKRIVDRQHDALKLVVGANHTRSIRKPRAILDLGTGRGAWAADIALEYATADEVVGVDIEPIDSSYFPPNCRFEVPLPFSRRSLAGCGCLSWDTLSRELFLVCAFEVDEDRNT